MLQIIPKDLNPLEVLERYLTEETTSQIAQGYGVSRKALVGWLREAVPEQWKRVQIIRALARKDDGNDGFETAEDALSLARSREMVKSAQFDLAALDSTTWGPKSEVTVKAEIKMESVLDDLHEAILTRIQSRVIDVSPIQQIEDKDA